MNDTLRMTYNLDGIIFESGLDLRDHFPRLSGITALWETPLGKELDPKRQLIIMWIIWMHDSGSPVHAFNSMPEKRSYIRKKLNITPNRGKFLEPIEAYDNTAVNSMVIAFLRFSEKSIEYTQLRSLESIHAKLMEETLKTPTKSNLEAIESAEKQIQNLKNKILSQVHSLKLEQQMISVIIEENLGINYVDLIEKLDNGEEIHPAYGVRIPV